MSAGTISAILVTAVVGGVFTYNVFRSVVSATIKIAKRARP